MRLRGQTEDCNPQSGWREARPKAISIPLSIRLRYSAMQDMSGHPGRAVFRKWCGGNLQVISTGTIIAFGSIVAVERFVEHLTVVIA